MKESVYQKEIDLINNIFQERLFKHFDGISPKISKELGWNKNKSKFGNSIGE